MGELTIEAARHILSRPGYKPEVCIETGTRNGNSAKVWATLLSEVHTIEIRKEPYLKAIKNNTLKNIHFYHGDSSKVLPKLIKRFQQPVLFYLDAHRSRTGGKYNGFPIWNELEAIKRRNFGDIVAIDDVHAFGRKKKSGGASTWDGLTVETITKYLRSRIKEIKVFDDCCTAWLEPREEKNVL